MRSSSRGSSGAWQAEVGGIERQENGVSPELFGMKSASA